jgi:uncharacterized membrane protein YgcG
MDLPAARPPPFAHHVRCSLQVAARTHELGSRQLSTLAWAFAVRRAYSPALFDALAARALQLLQSSHLEDAGGSSGAVGDSSSSSSSGGGSSSSSSSGGSVRLLTADGEEVLPQHLALLAWSFAKQVGELDG